MTVVKDCLSRVSTGRQHTIKERKGKKTMFSRTLHDQVSKESIDVIPSGKSLYYT